MIMWNIVDCKRNTANVQGISTIKSTTKPKIRRETNMHRKRKNNNSKSTYESNRHS